MDAITDYQGVVDTITDKQKDRKDFAANVKRVEFILSKDELNNLAQEAIEKFGENEWKKEVVSMIKESSDSDETYNMWKLLQSQVDSGDKVLLSELLCLKKIAKSPDRSIKAGILQALENQPRDPTETGVKETTTNLKNAALLLSEFIHEENRFDEDQEMGWPGDGNTAFLAKGDLHSVFKIILLTDENGVSEVEKILESPINGIDNEFKNQVTEMLDLAKQENFDKLRRTYYRNDLGESDDDTFSYYNNQFELDTKIDWLSLESPPERIEPYNDFKITYEPAIFGKKNETENLEGLINRDYDFETSEPAKPEIENTPPISEVDPKLMSEIATEIFKDDVRYMIEQLDLKPDWNEDGDEYVYFRALMMNNPADDNEPPIIITRPNETVDESIDYSNGSDHNIFHYDIWEVYKSLAKSQPDSKRADLARMIAAGGGYDSLKHIYLYAKKSQNGDVTIEIRSGMYSIMKNDGRDAVKMRQLAEYGVGKVNYKGFMEDKGLAESLVLRDMLTTTIEKNAQELARIVTPKSVRQYKNLAARFLTTSNPDKNSVLYQRFLEFQSLLYKS